MYTVNYFNKKVIIVGGSGFVGTQLSLRLLALGAHVTILDPFPSPLKDVIYIKTDLKSIPNLEALQKPFAVFNLAGISIFGRWNKSYKEKVRTSRIDTTKNLVDTFKNELYRPEYFVSTSAIGVYGDRGDEMLDENSKTVQNTYLAQVAYDWEQEAFRAKEFGVSVRIVRNAHVLGRGGILGVLRKVFMIGLGGSLGKGSQYMSFVSMEKCLDAYLQAPFQDFEIKNAVSLEPLTNRSFSKILARVLHRPCLFRIPVFGMKLVYGNFAKEIVTSQRIYSVHDPVFEDLETVLKKNL